MKHKLQKSKHRLTLRTKEKEENQKLTPNARIETKIKFKNIERMEIEIDSRFTFKKPR